MLQFQQAQTKLHNNGIIPITAKTKTGKPKFAALIILSARWCAIKKYKQ
jgi:hypothetical protein